MATILVIDDNPANRYVRRCILEHAGYDVREAGSGRMVLELAHLPPDLILLDLRLPDLDGFEITRRLKADPRTAAIPVLHVTAAYLAQEDQKKSAESGADGYLVAPVDPADLVAVVAHLLRRASGGEAA